MFPDDLNPPGSQMGFLSPLIEMFRSMFSRDDRKLNKQIAGKPFYGSPTPNFGSWGPMVQSGDLNPDLVSPVQPPPPPLMSGTQTVPTPAEVMPYEPYQEPKPMQIPSWDNPMIPRPAGYEGPLLSPEEQKQHEERMKQYRQEMGLPPTSGMTQVPMLPQAQTMADMMSRLPPNVLKKMVYSRLPKRTYPLW